MSYQLLSAEQPIIERLKAQVTGVTGLNVTSTASIVDTLPDALLPKLPLLAVQPGGGEVTDYAGNGIAAAEEAEWIVVVVVQLLPDLAGLARTYHGQAGSLIGKTVLALAGWAPPSHRPMRYAGRDEPVFSPGYVEFALRFTARHLFKGTGG